MAHFHSHSKEITDTIDNIYVRRYILSMLIQDTLFLANFFFFKKYSEVSSIYRPSPLVYNYNETFLLTYINNFFSQLLSLFIKGKSIFMHTGYDNCVNTLWGVQPVLSTVLHCNLNNNNR